MNVMILLASLLIGLVIGTPGGPDAAYAAPAESMPVWRAQLLLRTANVGDAGTDDSVRVQLNANNSTWVDYGRDDFERGDAFTYDLLQTGVSRLSDITMLSISKTGSDAWCLDSLSLLVNGRAIYDERFSPCKWIGNGVPSTYTVTSARLRQNATWRNYTMPPLPLQISRGEIESRVAGIVGNQIHGTPVYWGKLYGRAVEAWRKDSQTVHIDLDLALTVDYWFDPEVDIDFDLRFSCSAGRISIRTANVNADVDFNWLTDLLSLGLINFLESELARRIERGLQNITYAAATGVPLCPTISVDANGNVVFSLR